MTTGELNWQATLYLVRNQYRDLGKIQNRGPFRVSLHTLNSSASFTSFDNICGDVGS